MENDEKSVQIATSLPPLFCIVPTRLSDPRRTDRCRFPPRCTHFASAKTANRKNAVCEEEELQAYVLVLEELSDAEEEGGGLLGTEGLADIEEVDDFGEEDAALAGADGSLVEDARFLDDGLWSVPVASHERKQSKRVSKW